METLLGLAMFYVWIHGTVVVFKKTKDTTSYEKFVLIAGLVALVLLVIGVATS